LRRFNEEDKSGLDRIEEVSTDIENQIIGLVNHAKIEAGMALELPREINGIQIRDYDFGDQYELMRTMQDEDGSFFIGVNRDMLFYDLVLRLTLEERQLALKILFAHELAEIESKKKGLGLIASHSVAMMVEAAFMNSLSKQEASDETKAKVKLSLWRIRELYLNMRELYFPLDFKQLPQDLTIPGAGPIQGILDKLMEAATKVAGWEMSGLPNKLFFKIVRTEDVYSIMHITIRSKAFREIYADQRVLELLNKGLLPLNDFIALLSHEIGHILLNHYAALNLIDPNIDYYSTPEGLQMEIDANLAAIQILRKAGYDPAVIVDLYEKKTIPRYLLTMEPHEAHFDKERLLAEIRRAVEENQDYDVTSLPSYFRENRDLPSNRDLFKWYVEGRKGPRPALGDEPADDEVRKDLNAIASRSADGVGGQLSVPEVDEDEYSPVIFDFDLAKKFLSAESIVRVPDKVFRALDHSFQRLVPFTNELTRHLGKHWVNALSVPFQEMVRDPEKYYLNSYLSESQINAWANQIELRAEFLLFLMDISSGRFDINNLQELKKEFEYFNMVLLLGFEGAEIVAQNRLSGDFLDFRDRQRISFYMPATVFDKKPEYMDSEDYILRVAGRLFQDDNQLTYFQSDVVNVLGQIRKEKNMGFSIEWIKSIFEFYRHSFTNSFPNYFEIGSNSFRMQMFNCFLRLFGEKGIPHRDFDEKIILGKNKEAITSLREEMIKTNPDLQLPLSGAMIKDFLERYLKEMDLGRTQQVDGKARPDLNAVASRGSQDLGSLTAQADNKTRRDGGINFNPEDLNLETRGGGIDIPQVDMKQLENMQIDGFVPVIINITPVTNLMMILGLTDNKKTPSDGKDNQNQQKISFENLPAIKETEYELVKVNE